MTTVAEITWGGPGCFNGIAFEQYRALEAINKSLLCQMAITPADGRAFLDGDGETSKALDFGIGAHCLILEPAKFREQFAIGPDVKLNTREGKAEWAHFLDCHSGKIPIRGGDAQDMIGMRAALYQHPLAKQLLCAKGASEETIVWTHKPTGALCKARLDRRIEWDGGTTAIIDYKSTVSASLSYFPRAYGDLKYYLQEAFYRDGTKEVFGEPVHDFFFIAQEKKSPFKVNVFKFPAARVEQGRKLYHELIDLVQWCRGKGEWPAFDGREYFPAAIETDVPDFVMRAAE